MQTNSKIPGYGIRDEDKRFVFIFRFAIIIIVYYHYLFKGSFINIKNHFDNLKGSYKIIL